MQQTIHSIHDTAGQRIAEYLYNDANGTSTLIREFNWANNMVVGVVEIGTLYYVRTDHIGRPVFTTDNAGTKVWEATGAPPVRGRIHPSDDLRDAPHPFGGMRPLVAEAPSSSCRSSVLLTIEASAKPASTRMGYAATIRLRGSLFIDSDTMGILGGWGAVFPYAHHRSGGQLRIAAFATGLGQGMMCGMTPSPRRCCGL